MQADIRFLYDVFKHEYRKRINEVIEKAPVFDKDGNLLLTQDLKVRHKKSGFEYTIDHVAGSPGSLEISLRTPDRPRPAISQSRDPLDAYDEKNENDVIFVIDQSEFEKEYEVD
jgi:hypothetical protein